MALRAPNHTDYVSKYCGVFLFPLHFSTLLENMDCSLKKSPGGHPRHVREETRSKGQVQSGMSNLLLSVIKWLCRKGQRDKLQDPPPWLYVWKRGMLLKTHFPSDPSSQGNRWTSIQICFTPWIPQNTSGVWASCSKGDLPSPKSAFCSLFSRIRLSF